MRFLFLNQYFPPDPAPTGIQLAELAEHLRARGHEVLLAASGQDYRASGKGKQRRIWRELKALGTIFMTGILGPRPDVVLSGSSPPCLLVVATLVAMRHRARSVHWVMDMYPELAVALGEVKSRAVARFFETIMGWAYRKTWLLVALDEDMSACLQTDYGVPSKIIHPWPSEPLLEAVAKAERTPKEPWTWIYSGNLGRAHEWETILHAQALVESAGAPIRLRFQGGGPSCAPAKELARKLGLERCEWQNYVVENALPRSLLRCHALVVTQRPESQGYLWPSKLALAMDIGRPILWIGPAKGAIARMLRVAPSSGIFEPGQAREISQWLLETMSKGVVDIGPSGSGREYRTDALAKWTDMLERLCAQS